MLRELEPDTVYRIELRAHNAIGNSLSTEIRVRTARGEPLPYYSYHDNNNNGVKPSFVSNVIINVVCSATYLLIKLYV